MRRLILLGVLAVLALLPGLAEAQPCNGCGIGYWYAGVPATGGTFTGTVSLATGSTFYLYNTADQTTNYERFKIGWSGNQVEIKTEVGGSGTARPILIYPAGPLYFNANLTPYSGDLYSVGTSTIPWIQANVSRVIQGSKSTTLTDAAAAVSIWRIAVATNSYAGGKLIFTANSTDGTNRLTTTGEVTFAGADTGGTVTCGIGTPYGVATAYRRANTLVCTFTAVTATTNCDIQVTCTDDLAGSQTMAIESRVDMPKPNTATPQ